jgi:hypothetical protein
MVVFYSSNGLDRDGLSPYGISHSEVQQGVCLEVSVGVPALSRRQAE